MLVNLNTVLSGDVKRIFLFEACQLFLCRLGLPKIWQMKILDWTLKRIKFSAGKRPCVCSNIYFDIFFHVFS
jgi:hypothetical protein